MVITEGIQPHIWMVSGISPQVWGGGGEEAVNVVARHFADSGFKVSSLHGVINDWPPREEPVPDNLSLREIPQSNFLSFKGFSLEYSLAFRRLLQSEEPDFVVINMPSSIGLAAALALMNSAIPTTFWWHGHVASGAEYAEYDYQYPPSKIRSLARRFIFSPLKKAVIRRIIEASNFSHAVCSKFTMRVLENKGILSTGTAELLNPPTAVGLDNIVLGGNVFVDGIRDDDLVVFIPARIAPDKQFYNVRELISGLQEVSGVSRRINFVSAGPTQSSEYFKYAFPQVDTVNVKATYLGVLDKRGMERVYSRANCIFMPSRAEPFGLATVEGMRLGLPVLGYNSGGTQEILREFPNYPQYLIGEKRGQVRINSVEAFIVDTPNQRLRALNQRELVMERFDPEKLAQQVFDFVTKSL